MGDCVATGLAAPLRVRVVREQPTLTGPLRLGNLRCGEVAVADLAARVDVTFGAALDRWQGRASVGSGAISHPVIAAAAIDGQLDFRARPRARRAGCRSPRATWRRISVGPSGRWSRAAIWSARPPASTARRS